MTAECIARRIEINGVVQGVGFRPYVYQLARRHGLAGEIANTAGGVTLCVEGFAERIEAFRRDLTAELPPLAQITEIHEQPAAVSGLRTFSILKSEAAAQRATLIAPDVAICNDCLGELLDPRNRRFGYPFINCTNCGPRYTIIDDIPYDRPQTSMRVFDMCPQCQAEYDDPLDRRFHAQPNACAVCGPQVALFDRKGAALEDPYPIAAAARRLQAGQVLAVKGLGGFHLAVDATSQAAVSRLRQRKQREEKPLAVMSYDVGQVRRYAQVAPEAQRLLESIQRPIVLVPKNEPNPLATAVAPRNRFFGVMLPYTPLHYLLMRHGFLALVMTSGNISEEPIVIDNQEAFERLEGIADCFLVHNREIYLRSDDSIVRHAAGATRFIRRSRGYVPVPIALAHRSRPVLACGAELKNTVCLTRAHHAFVSQHIGDLENPSSYRFFQATIEHLKRILSVTPALVAYDLHPDYLSTRYALGLEGVERVAVQHHHAHIAGCLAENRVDGPALGLAFDGTGYGTDGCIWGGEVLVVEADRYTRAAQLAYVPMPGGAAAIREPWRMALSHLHMLYGEALWALRLPFLRKFSEEQRQVVTTMIERRVNAPQTSSLGRLFDAVAALAGLRGRVAFEGQAAMELEMAAVAGDCGGYEYAWETAAICQVLPEPLLRGVIADVEVGRSIGVISAKFHATLIQLFTDLCEALGRTYGLRRVALSGGVFQNSILQEGLSRSLAQRGWEVYTHKQVPANDGGISLGQAYVADRMAAGDPHP